MIFFTSPAVPVIEQIPLIHTINEDDLILLNSPEGEWFRMLNSFPWQDYRELAAHYYDALYDFNRSESGDPDRTDDPGESEEEAKLRLLSGRATVDRDERFTLS